MFLPSGSLGSKTDERDCFMKALWNESPTHLNDLSPIGPSYGERNSSLKSSSGPAFFKKPSLTTTLHTSVCFRHALLQALSMRDSSPFTCVCAAAFDCSAPCRRPGSHSPLWVSHSGLLNYTELFRPRILGIQGWEMTNGCL